MIEKEKEIDVILTRKSRGDCLLRSSFKKDGSKPAHPRKDVLKNKFCSS